MHMLRRIFRLMLLTIYIPYGVLLLLFAVGPNPMQRSTRDWSVISHWMTGLCKILGLRITAQGHPITGPALFVSNHISWQDIVVIQSLVPTGFIAKHEIRSWPLIGWMAHRGNTLFIRRGKRESLPQIKKAMASRFGQKQNILIFPEGTTSTGETVLPFRTRLLEPAINLKLPVQPIAIHYSSAGKTNKELAYVEDDFLKHALRLLGEQQINVIVQFCEVISTISQDRRDLGQIAQNNIIQALTNHSP